MRTCFRKGFTLLFTAGLLFSLAACSGGEGAGPGGTLSTPQAEPSGPESSLQEGLQPGASQEEAGVRSVVPTCIGPYSLDQLAEESTLVVRGSVTDADLLDITGLEGGELLFTEYHIAVEEVLRGDAEDRVSVRRVGNPEADEGTVFPGQPVLEQGKEYLLFLQIAPGGGSYNTAGVSYTFVGAAQGVFEQTGPVPGRETEEILYTSQQDLENIPGIRETFRQLTDGAKREEVLGREVTATRLGLLSKQEVSLTQLRETVDRANEAVPPDPELPERAVRESLERNYREGAWTREEYEQRLADLEKQAVITLREPLFSASSE